MNQTMNKTMKTVAIDRFGGLNEMKIRELPVPELDANEILVRVEAAGVGVWDPFEREGGFAKEFNMSPKFPIILGSDGAGTVQAIGEKVSHLTRASVSDAHQDWAWLYDLLKPHVAKVIVCDPRK